MNTLLMHRPSAQAQRGAILIAVLAILITLTLLGLAGMRSTMLEERMAGNFQEKYLAFQAAEAAARVAEAALDDKAARDLLSFNGSAGTYDVTDAGGDAGRPVNPFSAFSNPADVVAVDMDDGRPDGTGYYIERMPERTWLGSSLVTGFSETPPKQQLYRITARGVGLSGDTEVILMTTWAL